MNCTEPPERASSGTWEWNGQLQYGTSVLYTCGPYGNFQAPSGEKYAELESRCAWNKTFSPGTLDPCVATSCQVIPFPPSEIGMVYSPDENNRITLASEFNIYNPRLPLGMKFPGPEFCADNGDIMMIVGSFPEETIFHFCQPFNLTVMNLSCFHSISQNYDLKYSLYRKAKNHLTLFLRRTVWMRLFTFSLI